MRRSRDTRTQREGGGAREREREREREKRERERERESPSTERIRASEKGETQRNIKRDIQTETGSYRCLLVAYASVSQGRNS